MDELNEIRRKDRRAYRIIFAAFAVLFFCLSLAFALSDSYAALVFGALLAFFVAMAVVA